VVQDTKWLSAGSVNRVRQRWGSAWQHQFWDRLVRQAKEFNDRLAYMHLNPVGKGLAARPEDWR
jgi:REP element-mobilizing transposase RayT